MQWVNTLTVKLYSCTLGENSFCAHMNNMYSIIHYNTPLLYMTLDCGPAPDYTRVLYAVLTLIHQPPPTFNYTFSHPLSLFLYHTHTHTHFTVCWNLITHIIILWHVIRIGAHTLATHCGAHHCLSNIIIYTYILHYTNTFIPIHVVYSLILL